MAADAKLALLPRETAEEPAGRRDAPQKQPERPAAIAAAPEKAPGPSRRRWVRPTLFALLPLAVIVGAYWYVTGGQVMSTDDAYVEADKVGISTDVSGIVKEIDVSNNQEVAGGQVLFRMDDLPFRLALERAEAQVGIVRNDLNALKANYRDMQAPVHGIVTNVPACAPGKYLHASVTAFYRVATDHLWVDSNPKEAELTYVRPGQHVTVAVDTYADVEWHGTIESISPAAAEEFSLLPAQNTSGNWVKVVQRIPMRVRVDTSDKNLPPLRAGMSVEVDVDTGHIRGWPHFLTTLSAHASQEP